jgi:hypothetical protein
MNKTKKLSEKFNEIVNKEFSVEQLAEINAKNKTAEYISCCATHDYCDANMLMDEAFTSVIGREIDLQNENDCQLWSNAWDLSKDNDFKTI